MRDSLFEGKQFCAFNGIDDFNREALNIKLVHTITNDRVIGKPDHLIAWRRKHRSVRLDNGPEYITECYETGGKGRIETSNPYSLKREKRVRMDTFNDSIKPMGKMY